ncbi:restriction endonuclease subunit S [Aliarcobacter trophiarum]|uniref:restriction endonuclease subunit S n=1 Tax=Aliarcobacter trophiarum TaxID=708186 RepID=UPI00100BE6B5|nr:restriction endonuclease subunit S [Aliarcobacter trophiarum]RXI25285.1 hypothetical protein CRU89_07920 [Aliarcobacter trophiarum]
MSELYNLPDGWEWKKLGNIGKISTGKTPPKANKEFYKNGTIRFIKPPNLQNSYNIQKVESDEFVTEDGAKKSTLLPKNTLMVCCIGSLGKFAISTENVITNQQINSIIFYEDIINYKYGYYYGFKLEKLLNEVANEAVVKIVNKTIFSNLDIPLPPLEEQKRIVAKLDILFEKIDKVIALHQKNCEEADIFMASVLNDAFVELEEKYEKKQLNEIIKIIGGGTPSKANKEYWENGTIKWATVRDMNVEKIIKTELSITEIGLKNSSSNIIPKNGIVIATRVGLGKVCYLEDDTAINQDLKGLISKKADSLNIRYLFNFFKNIEKHILSNGTGATVKGVKLEFIKELEIPLPPLKTQQKVVASLDEISNKMKKIKNLQKEKMQSLKELKASILDKAFKGKL